MNKVIHSVKTRQEVEYAGFRSVEVHLGGLYFPYRFEQFHWQICKTIAGLTLIAFSERVVSVNFYAKTLRQGMGKLSTHDVPVSYM